MRRGKLWIVVMAAVLGLATGGVALAGPSGSQIHQGVWTGKTSQGRKLSFDVLQDPKKGLIVQPTELVFDMVCSSTGTEFRAGFGFIGFSAKVGTDGSFRFHFYDELFGVLSFGGTLERTTGSGTELAALPGITKDLGSETCSSGTVTWHAKAPTGMPASADSNLTYRVTLTRDQSGHVTESITKG